MPPYRNQKLTHSHCTCFDFLNSYFLGGASTYLSKYPVAIPDKEFAKEVKEGLNSMLSAGRRFSIATWNIAAINNNPFEYWITYKENPNYEKLMVDVENFISNPTIETDISVSEVFTNEMFMQLDQQLTSTCGWQSVKSYWDSDFKNRKIITGFLKVSVS